MGTLQAVFLWCMEVLVLLQRLHFGTGKSRQPVFKQLTNPMNKIFYPESARMLLFLALDSERSCDQHFGLAIRICGASFYRPILIYK